MVYKSWRNCQALSFAVTKNRTLHYCRVLLFSEYEYVDKEEHDAKLLFSGKLLKEYHVNKDTGEIEEIQ